MRKIFLSYSLFLKNQPILSRCVTSAVVLSTGDAISQIFVEKNPFNYQRNIRSGVMGFSVIGLSLYGWYNKIHPLFVSNFLKKFPYANKYKFLTSTIIDQSIFPFYIVSSFLFWVNFFEVI